MLRAMTGVLMNHARWWAVVAEILCPRAKLDADGTIICTAMARPMLCIMYDCDLWIGRRITMNKDAMKQLSILLAEIEAIKIEVMGMNSANAERIAAGEELAYPEKEFARMANEIRAIIDKMRRIDTRPEVS